MKFFCIIILLSTMELFSESIHVKDAKACFAISEKATPEAQRKMVKIFNFVYNEMDQGGNNCQGWRIKKLIEKLKDIDNTFSVGDYGHRLFFHNGFICGDEIYDIPITLRKQLFKYDKVNQENNYKENKAEISKLYKSSQDDFYYCIVKKFKRKFHRNKFQFNHVGNGYGDGIAFIKIIYDIHILRDYEEAKSNPTKEAIMPFGELIRDLQQAIRICGYKDKDFLNQLIDREFTQKSKNEKTEALRILQALKIWFPKIIEKNPKLKQAVWE